MCKICLKTLSKVWLGRTLHGKQNNLNIVFQNKRLQDPFIFSLHGNYWILCKIVMSLIGKSQLFISQGTLKWFIHSNSSNF